MHQSSEIKLELSKEIELFFNSFKDADVSLIMYEYCKNGVCILEFLKS